jgi:hypothetical protein
VKLDLPAIRHFHTVVVDIRHPGLDDVCDFFVRVSPTSFGVSNCEEGIFADCFDVTS